jgi:hypothetical protein
MYLLSFWSPCVRLLSVVPYDIEVCCITLCVYILWFVGEGEKGGIVEWCYSVYTSTPDDG